MDLTRDSFERVKQKAEERISDWIDNCQKAGITRLHDQYGQLAFKRIEFKKNDAGTEVKAKFPSKLKPLKPVKNEKEQIKGGRSPDAKERTKRADTFSVSTKSRQGTVSRQTIDYKSDSFKRYRDSPTLIREMNNKSAHNRSSFKSSICSMDAISLLCDDPNQSINPKHFDSYSPISHNFLEKKLMNDKQNKTYRVPDRLTAKEQNVVERVEKTFYNCKNFENFKPAKPKLVRKSGKIRKIKVPASPSHISEEQKSSVDENRDTLLPDKDLPARIYVHRPSIKRATDSPSPSFIRITAETPIPSSSPTLKLSHVPSTITIDARNAGRASTPLITFGTCQSRVRSSIATDRLLNTSSPTSLGLRPSRSEMQVLTSERVKDTMALSLKRQKSKVSRINLTTSPTHSTSLRSGKSSTLTRTMSRRFPIPPIPCSSGSVIITDGKALKRFRKFTNKFIAVSRLLNAVKAKMRQQTKEEICSVKKEERSNVLDFDVSYFKSATTSYGGLSIRAREALWKRVNLRTEKDIQTLREVMNRLPFFHKYAENVKAELARMLWYDRFEDERVIIKQGDIGSRMYFVVSGCVSMQTTSIDPRTGQKVVIHLKDVKSGATFGELALIRDMKRDYTAVCKGDCEFLSLSKNEFNNVLRHKWEQDWQSKYNFIKSLPSFEGASPDQIKNATDMAEIKNYSDNTVIFGDKSHLTEAVFFINKGKCDMIKKVQLLRTQSPYLRPSLFLPSPKNQDTSKFMNKSYGKQMRISRTENHLLTVMSLYQGDYFGAGEDLTDTFIISKGKVECLLINSAFYAINLMVDRQEKMKTEREKKIPPNLELYKRFEENRRWTEYKKNLVEGVKKRKMVPNVTTTTDIPKILTMEPNIPADLLWMEKHNQ